MASVTKTAFGKLPDGREVQKYTLTNRAGASAEIITYGAAVTSLCVPDRDGKIEDVVLGYDNLEGYIKDTAYLGAIVGRYGNRIAKGRFKLDGKEYQLTVNDGENHLHGGKVGFNKVVWEAKVLRWDTEDPALQLQYVSRDGEEGYPGTVTLKVTYTLTEKNELRIEYEGTTDKPTILNPTSHSYFNLLGNPKITITGHTLMIEADSFTPVDKALIPTGQILSVENTPMDFRTPTSIALHIGDADEQIAFGKGYDHNWVLRGSAGQVRKVAELSSSSGRVMTVYTDQPGLQFYTGNFLDGSAKGKNGIAYAHRTGLCLETQAYPDTPNKPSFPQVTLRPGQTYHQTTIYQFSTR